MPVRRSLPVSGQFVARISSKVSLGDILVTSIKTLFHYQYKASIMRTKRLSPACEYMQTLN